MSIVDNFRGKNLDLSKCQGTRWNGDNPLTPFWTNTFTTLSPTFYHHFLYYDSIKTTFFPLTLSGGPFFYYIRFPDKKGTLSVEGGETTVGSVTEGFYPPSTREPTCCYGHLVWVKIGPFVYLIDRWEWRQLIVEESGRIMDSHKLDRRSYLTSPSLTHKLYRVVTIFPIIGCITDILFYRLINRYLTTSHLSLRMVGTRLLGGGLIMIHY